MYSVMLISLEEKWFVERRDNSAMKTLIELNAPRQWELNQQESDQQAAVNAFRGLVNGCGIGALLWLGIIGRVKGWW